MTFLKKLGGIAVKIGQFAPYVGPIIKGFLPTAAAEKFDRAMDWLSDGIDVVVGVEAIGQTLGLAGTQKLTAATPLIADMLVRHPFFTGKKIKDPVLFKAGAEKLAGGLADILNSLDEGSVGEVTTLT
jgi:hypothetical protein